MRAHLVGAVLGLSVSAGLICGQLQDQRQIGREGATPKHLQDGEEFGISLANLITYGRQLFQAHFTHSRLKPVNGVVMVPLYTDFKLHDICRGPDDPNREALNQNAS